ncbi:MAG: ABC transporter permease [bacterium]|nr:ABC transporter permease [bacterium]
MAWLNFRQSGILADRYFDILLGDLKNTLLLLFQAPIIAGLIVLVWRNVEEPTNTLYFVLVLTSIWFGCSNASREIVKERAIFFRERMVGIEVPAYLFSKLRILAMLGFVQCLALLLIVNYQIHLLGNKLLLFASLYACSMAGTSLGLLISAVMNSQDKAVGMVPLVMIPQILFSEFALPKDLHEGLTKYLERLMFVGWGYENFKQIVTPEPDYLTILRNIGVLALFGGFFFYVTIVVLKRKKP